MENDSPLVALLAVVLGLGGLQVDWSAVATWATSPAGYTFGVCMAVIACVFVSMLTPGPARGGAR